MLNQANRNETLNQLLELSGSGNYKFTYQHVSRGIIGERPKLITASRAGIQECSLRLHRMSSCPCKPCTCSLSFYRDTFLLANFRLSTAGVSSILSLLSLCVRYIQCISSLHFPTNLIIFDSHPRLRLLSHICRWSGEVLECLPGELGFRILFPESIFGTLRLCSGNAAILLVDLQLK